MIHARPRDEGTEIAVACAVLREQHDVREEGILRSLRRHLERQFRSDDPVHSHGHCRRRKSHGPAKVIAVGQRERRHAQLDGARDELLWLRGSVE